MSLTSLALCLLLHWRCVSYFTDGVSLTVRLSLSRRKRTKNDSMKASASSCLEMAKHAGETALHLQDVGMSLEPVTTLKSIVSRRDATPEELQEAISAVQALESKFISSGWQDSLKHIRQIVIKAKVDFWILYF